MNQKDQEKIYISNHNSTPNDQFLTLKDVLIMKECWPAKYSAYAKKNKLITLRDEFYRRVSKEEIHDLSKKVWFWAKIERCDFTSDESKLRMLFEKMKIVYERLTREDRDIPYFEGKKGNIKNYCNIEVKNNSFILFLE